MARPGARSRIRTALAEVSRRGGQAYRRKIDVVVGTRDSHRGVPLTRRVRWLGLGVFTLFAVVGLFIRMSTDYSRGIAIPGLLIAVAAAIPLFLVESRLMLLLEATIATAAVAMFVYDHSGSGNVGWFATCIVTAWCM